MSDDVLTKEQRAEVMLHLQVQFNGLHDALTELSVFWWDPQGPEFSDIVRQLDSCTENLVGLVNELKKKQIP